MGIDVSMYVKTKNKKSDDDLRDINYRFLNACSIGDVKQPIKLEEGSFVPQDGYFYYSVYRRSRYYGKGYSRGPWASINMAIEWLRINFEPCEILYGGDCLSDECPVFTKEDQEELTNFWAKSGDLTYRQKTPEKPEYQKDCHNCKVPMSQFMWTQNGAGIICLGCRYSIQTKDNGQTWEENKK